MKNAACTCIIHKRTVIATSMGVNFPDIRYVINWDPPRCVLDYHQESGKAGRDGYQSDAITYFYGQQLSHCEDDVKDFIKSTICLRVSSLLPFDHQIQALKQCYKCPCDTCSSCSALECIPTSGVHRLRRCEKCIKGTVFSHKCT